MPVRFPPPPPAVTHVLEVGIGPDRVHAMIEHWAASCAVPIATAWGWVASHPSPLPSACLPAMLAGSPWTAPVVAARPDRTHALVDTIGRWAHQQLVTETGTRDDERAALQAAAAIAAQGLPTSLRATLLACALAHPTSPWMRDRAELAADALLRDPGCDVAHLDALAAAPALRAYRRRRIATHPAAVAGVWMRLLETCDGAVADTIAQLPAARASRPVRARLLRAARRHPAVLATLCLTASSPVAFRAWFRRLTRVAEQVPFAVVRVARAAPAGHCMALTHEDLLPLFAAPDPALRHAAARLFASTEPAEE